MFDEYYRGSSSYEVAVKNRLNALEATGLATTRAVRNMETGIRSDIQANTNAIQEMTLGIRSDIRESTYAVVASQAMLAQTFQHGFNSVNNTLNFGFGMVSNKLDAMSDRICSKLDEIHDILNNPLLTQSRELYRRALNNYNRGYYEEALEDCKGAVEKNKTDFISWNLLGQIYLFGAGKFSNVIDVDKAEEAFFNAAKHIDSDIGQSDEANTLASEIYYYLGLVRLIKSNDLLLENKSAESNAKLIEAEKASGNAYRLSFKEYLHRHINTLAGYEQAKELHFLGKDIEALQILEELIRSDKNFALRASTDKNFEFLWGKIDALILSLRDEMAEEITKKCDKFKNSFENKMKDLQHQFNSIYFPSDKKITDFDAFYKSEDFPKWFAEYPSSKKCRFDEIAEEVAIQDNHYSEEEFTYAYRSIKNYPSIKKSALDGKVLIKKNIDEESFRITQILEMFESVQKEDYFTVLEKYKSIGQIPSDYNESKLSKTIDDLCTDMQCLRFYFDAQKPYEEYLEDWAAKENARYKSNSKSEKILKSIGSFIGIAIGLALGWVVNTLGIDSIAISQFIIWGAIIGAVVGFIFGFIEDGIGNGFGGGVMGLVLGIILAVIIALVKNPILAFVLPAAVLAIIGFVAGNIINTYYFYTSYQGEDKSTQRKELRIIIFFLILLLAGIFFLVKEVNSHMNNKAQQYIESQQASQLFDAIEKNDMQQVKELIESGVNVNKKDERGRTPLMHAVMHIAGEKKWNREYTESLIKAGADVNARDNDGSTPLMLAVTLVVPGYMTNASARNAVNVSVKDSADLLIKAGADVNVKNKYGGTALMRAAASGFSDSVDLLIKAGADVNAKESNGTTALMKAVGCGSIDSVDLLIKAGADVNAKENNFGNTALAYTEDKKILDLLRRAGAR